MVFDENLGYFIGFKQAVQGVAGAAQLLGYLGGGGLVGQHYEVVVVAEVVEVHQLLVVGQGGFHVLAGGGGQVAGGGFGQGNGARGQG